MLDVARCLGGRSFILGGSMGGCQGRGRGKMERGRESQEKERGTRRGSFYIIQVSLQGAGLWRIGLRGGLWAGSKDL